jgi:putative endopeptidase
MGLPAHSKVDVAEPSAVAAAGRRIADVPLSTWKDFLTTRFLTSHSDVLPTAIDQATFDFYSKTLYGVPEQRERWKRGIAMIDSDLGEALGQLYVAKYWSAESARQANELVEDVRAAYGEKIRGADWMDAATKAKALEKLAGFDPRVGYPSKWIDYSGLEISRSNPLANKVAAQQFRWNLDLKRFPNPVDRALWEMTPQTVNAYYSPLFNEIVFPAAILQPPFYDYKADAAVNFGGIGAVIGHELSHGFDDQGAKYDGNGNLNNWWSDSDKAKFEAAADALVRQFESYEPVPGVFVNGRFTLGENIGDLGGSSVAFDALQLYLKDKGNPGLIDGFTQDQRFFLSWATIWRTKTTDEFVVNQVKTDPHSPAQYRAFAPIINLDAFHKAWNTKNGDKMFVPVDKRIKIW